MNCYASRATPGLAVLGKIVGGGAPIGAICRNRDRLQYYKSRDDDDQGNRFARVSLGGTWNAQPVRISAGLESMKILKDNNLVPTARS